MISLKNKIKEYLQIHKIGKKILKDSYFISTKELTKNEIQKAPSRTEIINFLMQQTMAENYLEIGVRNPNDNFNHILCKNKYSVDPGLEFKENPVDFKLTSDDFFKQLGENKIEILVNVKFDIIFIDGLHISNQVENDIQNSLNYIKEDGFIVLHDCNPPTEFHQREDYLFRNSPAGGFWNGTTWKAFYKYRHIAELYSICFDTDWGVGVISKKEYPLFTTIQEKRANEFYEFQLLEQNRKDFLNLQLFEEWKKQLKN